MTQEGYLTTMVDATTKQRHPVLTKLLGFFNTLKAKDPLLYYEYIQKITDYPDILHVRFLDNWVLAIRTARKYKSDYFCIDIGDNLSVGKAHLRKWSPTTSLRYDENVDLCAKLAWKKAINKCKILKRIGFLNFKIEGGGVTEVYVRVDP